MSISIKEKGAWIYPLMFILFTAWPAIVLGNAFCILSTFSLLVFFSSKCIEKNENLELAISGLLICQLLSMIFGSFYAALDFGNVAAIIISFLIVTRISFLVFALIYTRLLFFLSAYSLATYVLSIFYLDIFTKLPQVEATSIAANAIFSLVPLQMGDYLRNFGAWGEPGMFAVYLFLALLLELFFIKPFNKLHIAVFIIAMFTTFSTSGFISTYIILIAFLFSPYGIKNTRTIIMFTLLIAGLGAGVVYVFTSMTDFLGGNAVVFSKLVQTDENDSSFERLRAFNLALDLIKGNFPLGSGQGVPAKFLLKDTIIMTATPLNWFAFYGVGYGLIMNYGIYRFCKRLCGSGIHMLFAFIGVISIIISQDMSRAYIFYILAFYAYSHDSIKQEVI